MTKAKQDLCEAQAREIVRLNAAIQSLTMALELAAGQVSAEEALRQKNNELAAENFLLIKRLAETDQNAMPFTLELMALKATNQLSRMLLGTGYQHAARDLKHAVQQVANPMVYDYVQDATNQMEMRATDLMAGCHA